MSEIQKIREKVGANQFILSKHVRDKLEQLELTVKDLIIVVKYGNLVETLTDDPRGNRYVIIGRAADNSEVELVCRFLDNGKVLFITCYDLYF